MSKVVIAEYTTSSAFKVPKGLDLEDKTQVKSYTVKWDRLFIELADGSEIQVENSWEAGFDFKYPTDELVIDDAEDHGFDDDSDEDETVDEAKARTALKTEAMDYIYKAVDPVVTECPHVDVCDSIVD